MQLDARWLIAPLVCLWPLAATADDSDAARLIAECSAPALPPASLDSCLERVRVLEETEPSSGLQALEASLEQRESAGPASTRTASAPAPAVSEVAPEPDIAAAGDEAQDESAARRAEPDNFPPRSGPSVEDEPPVADAPDVPSSTDRAADDTDGPPQS